MTLYPFGTTRSHREKCEFIFGWLLSRLELGLNTREDRLGVLFSEHLVDSMAGPSSDEAINQSLSGDRLKPPPEA